MTDFLGSIPFLQQLPGTSLQKIADVVEPLQYGENADLTVAQLGWLVYFIHMLLTGFFFVQRRGRCFCEKVLLKMDCTSFGKERYTELFLIKCLFCEFLSSMVSVRHFSRDNCWWVERGEV